MKNFNYLLLILLITSACSGLSDARKVLKNEKIYSTDEFLVKKREPLILPPNYDEIPEPGSSIQKNTEEEDIKKILKAPKTEDGKRNKSSTIEDSILNRIRK